MKKVSGRALLDCLRFEQLGTIGLKRRRRQTKQRCGKQIAKRGVLETESARAFPVGKYASLDWLIRRWNPSRRMEEPPSLVRKKPPPKGRPAQLPGRGSVALELEVHSATHIAKVEAIKLQRHVIQIFVDQVERGVFEVLVHSIEVESCRFDGLVESDEPVTDV
jgi:hypothetical protein